jgi:hypothetical protein
MLRGAADPVASSSGAAAPYDKYDIEKVSREQEEELLAMGVEPEHAHAGEPLTEFEEIELIRRLADRIGREQEAAQGG